MLKPSKPQKTQTNIEQNPRCEGPIAGNIRKSYVDILNKFPVKIPVVKVAEIWNRKGPLHQVRYSYYSYHTLLAKQILG